MLVSSDTTHRSGSIPPIKLIWLRSEKVNPGASGREAAEEACGAESPALKVTASAGDAILFYNAREDMYPDAMSMHAGCEVKHGSKYVITAWVWTNNHYMNEFGKDMQWIPTHDG